jgi:hypothetical protein
MTVMNRQGYEVTDDVPDGARRLTRWIYSTH